MPKLRPLRPKKKKKEVSSYQRRKAEIDELSAIKSKLNTLLDVSKNIMSEMHLHSLLERIMEDVTVVMNADRSTLFLVDKETSECWAFVAQGSQESFRFPVGVGLAGHVAKTGDTINIPEAYADNRFNPEFDKKTGYRTKSILTMPLKTNTDEIIGVNQVLNKRDNTPFTEMDEELLQAFSSLAAIAIQNARLYEEVLNEKNYNDSILTNIPSGVMTVNTEGVVVTANDKAFQIFGTSLEKLIDKNIKDFFKDQNLIIDAIEKARTTGEIKHLLDVEYINHSGQKSSINLNARSLLSPKGEGIGTVVVIEDITKEKRMQGTLSQYMSKEVAEQVLNNEVSLQGKRQKVTILFSDIRSFTSISEKSQPEDVVSLLNDYFDIMIDIIFKHEGILDKFIGDAIMALFGAPIVHEDDEKRAVQTAIEMIRALKLFNIRREENGLSTIDIGIGINTGDVLAGNVGSEKRMEYTVIGDAVNLASRLEGVTKNFPHKIIVSEFVYKEVKDDFEFDYLDNINVKGKDIAVKVYGVKEKYFID